MAARRERVICANCQHPLDPSTALLARATDREAHIAYGRLVEAGKAYWPDLHALLQQPHPKAAPAVVDKLQAVLPGVDVSKEAMK